MEFMESAIYMYKLGASFNYYMFAGGTNFGFWNGAEVAAPVSSLFNCQITFQNFILLMEN